MAGRRRRRTLPVMEVMDDLAWIYGAALATAGSERAARHVTERVVRAGGTRRSCVAAAVRLAIRTDPAAPFDCLATEDAEARPLVRVAGLRVGEVAALTGEDPATVSRRLTAGLQTLS